jgi:CelD/BcsL family acetyltransferase involved in cellulose biosynthesis
MSLATDAEHSEAVMQAFASEILSWDDWDTLKLDGVATGDENVRRLAELMQDADCSVSERTAFNCWRLELPGSLDEYLQSVSKNHRKKARRKLKKIESGEFAFKEAIDPASLAQGLSILEDLHQRRRKSLGEPGCFSDPRFKSLLEGVSTQALEKGTLRLFWFEHEGHPVAADFALVEGATVFAYQSGIAPEHLELEPGNVNNLWHIVRAIEEGQSAIDFLRGDEPYKAQIGASPMPHVNFRISSPSLLPKIKHQVLDVGLRIRDFVTPLIPATKS